MADPNQYWKTPPDDLKLSNGMVHIWRVSLEPPTSVIQNLIRLLSEDEVVKAHSFFFEKDSNHFIIARAVLRFLLGRYLDLNPSRLGFRYNPYGKPALDATFGESRLNFNLTHSRHLALYAFALSREVGIDIEFMHSNIEYEQLAKLNFSLYENTVFRALPEELRPQAFYNCWTRKEAYIKAKGEGLSIHLDQFDVSFRPGEPAALLNSKEGTQEVRRWSLQELAPGSGYSGTLAVEGRGWYPYYWQWDWQEMDDSNLN